MRLKRKLLCGVAALAVAVPITITTVNAHAAGVNPLPVTITNRTGINGPVYLYILSENLATKGMGYVNAAGVWTQWSGGGASPTPVPDVSIPGPANGQSVTLKIPQGVNGRIYFSFGEKLKLGVVNGDRLVQPAPWVPTDANFNIEFDWTEFTYDQFGLFINSTQVDLFGVPHTVESTGSNGPQKTGQVVDNGRNKVIDAISKQPGFEKTIVRRPDGSVLRVLAPGKAADGGLFDANYLDPYITKAWNAYTDKDLVVQPIQVDPSIKFFGRTSGNAMTFRNTSGAVVATVQKPSTKDVWGCDGNLVAPNNELGLIARTLCAALNRGTLGESTVEPVYDASKFYKNNPTNHYSRIIHENMVDGKAYGFAFDDVGAFESLIKDPNPTSATITLDPLGPGGGGKPNPKPSAGNPNPSPAKPSPSAGNPNPNPNPSPAKPSPSTNPGNPGNPGGTAWAPYQAYSAGTVVTFGGRSYRCVQSHTSLPGWEPGPWTAALWAAI